MARYRLAARALKDVAEIVTYLHRVHGSSVADRAETRLFGAFDDLGSGRSRGHRRSDLTDRDVLFHSCPPYVIILRPAKDSVLILRVVHGSRDIPAIL